MKNPSALSAKPVRWIGSSKNDLSTFPNDAKLRIGGALWDAQIGVKSSWAKPLKGFGGAGVLEIVSDVEGNAFRAVYTIRFAEAVYVTARLARAKEDYEQWLKSRSSL